MGKCVQRSVPSSQKNREAKNISRLTTGVIQHILKLCLICEMTGCESSSDR